MSPLTVRFVLLAVVALAALPAAAQPIVLSDTWGFAQNGGSATLAYDAAATGPPGVRGVMRIVVARPSDPFYYLQAVQAIPHDVPAGRRVRLTFWARSSTGNPIRADVEKAGPPWTAAADLNVVLTPEWKRYVAMGPTPGFGPNGLSVHFQFGHQAGQIDIAGIRLEDIGVDPDVVASCKAVQPDAVEARIRQYRTGRLRVMVADAHGKPVAGAAVSVEQTRHAFLFGCNIFALEPGSGEAWQKQYQERFAALFNYATLPFYWGSFEWEQGHPQYARLDAMAKWCTEHGIATKGHPLVWHEVYPAWAPRDPDQAIPLLRQRVLDIIRHYGRTVRYWDVLNEANNAAQYAGTGEGAWIKRDGPAKVVATALGWAREASKGLDDTLLYNDFNTGQEHMDLLAALQREGALPDAIGIQSHMHGGVWPLEQVWATTERFARFGKPVHYTETTVLSGPQRSVDMNHPPADWLTTPEDEAKQADYVARFYSLLFSHPAMRAITWWDLSDRVAWQNAPAGFLRKDISPKPVYDRLMALIKGAWWTRAHGTTGRTGAYETRAFYGDYAIAVRDLQGRTTRQTISFPMGSGTRVVTVQMRG